MTSYERIEKVIRYIEAHRLEQPRLDTLARVAGLSEFHFHRLFRRWAGTTPKAFLKYLTSEHAKTLLLQSKDVLSASFEAGLSGPGRLHDLLVSVEGVTPGELKARGEGLEIRHGLAQTPFGPAFFAWTRRGVCGLEFEGAAGRAGALRRLRARWPKARLLADAAGAAALSKKVFARKRAGAVPVLLAGTPFQLKVWAALLRIPAGKTAAYGDVARAIGRPKAARAVGAAVGKNAVAYLIPCHRVLRGAGLLGGYRWGPARKRALLAWEGA